MAVGLLMVVARYYGERFEGPYLILALIVFSLTFPGATYSASSLPGLAREVVLNWLVVVAILLFFGYASGYLSLFPLRMVLSWSAGVPMLLFLVHATAPLLAPRVLALESMRRTAVIAGASELGAKLTAQIASARLMGIQLRGVFDDRQVERRTKIEGVPCSARLSSLPTT